MPDDEIRYDVFISYARKDGLAFAERLETALRAAGYTVWRDKRDLNPDADFTTELESAIEQAGRVAVCVTEDTKRPNSFVRREIGYALAQKKPVVPLIVDGTVPPIHIINVTRIDFLQQTWEAAFGELRDRLARVGETPDPISPPDDPFRPYLESLYERVINFLTQTVISPIDLITTASPNAVGQPSRSRAMDLFYTAHGLILEDEHPASFKTFREAFQRYHGRVLLLGESGSGKTITLLTHAREAIAARLDDPEQPLPLLEPIADWNASEHKQLKKWLVSSHTGLLEEDVTTVIREGRALLLLDGLDELGGERPVDPNKPYGEKYDPRKQFMALIPDNNQVLITCRVTDYQQIRKMPTLRGAVTLQPLSLEQMRIYLKSVPELLIAMEGDDELRAMLSTPLVMSLFAFAYRAMAPEDAAQLQNLKGSPGDLRDAIFERYVRERYAWEARKGVLSFTLDEVYQILGDAAVTDIEDWNPTNIFSRTTFLQLLGEENQSERFIELATKLHLLAIRDSDTLRFVHLLLRDYFAYSHTLVMLGADNPETRERAVGLLEALGDARAVEPLIEALRDIEANVRGSAADALGGLFGHQAIHPLIEALNDESAKVRRHAAVALGSLGDKIAVEPLVEALNDEDATVRSWVAYALGRLGNTRGVETLIMALEEDEETLRGLAANTLGNLGDTRAVEPLIQVLQHDTGDVRWFAAEALGNLGDARALEPLIQAVQGETEKVRAWAAEALGNLGDARALEPLIQALQTDTVKVRRSAAIALGKMRGEKALEPLIKALGDEDVWLSRYAASALGELGDRRAVEPLLAILQNNDAGRRRDAVDALGKLGDTRAVDPLINALRDDSAEVRSRAASALGDLGNTRAVEPLIEALHDEESWVRSDVAAALGQLGDARAVEPLIEALHDEDLMVSLSVVDALGMLIDE